MEELGIISITSRSSQSKGRIERLWNTLQDRLTSEMRLLGVSTIEDANSFLETFLPRFNRRFGITAREPGSAYRKVPHAFKPEEVFCFKYNRVTGMDNVVRFEGKQVQIMPCNGRQSYVRTRVEVQERMDGELAVYYKGQCLATVPAPAEAPVLRIGNTKRAGADPKTEEKELAAVAAKSFKPVARTPYKPAPDHPWRRGYIKY